MRAGPGPWPAGRDSPPPNGRAVLALPLIAVIYGLAIAGLMAAIRELAPLTMPFESIENLRVATNRGYVAAAAVVVGAIAVLNGGRRLRDIVSALDRRTGAKQVGLVAAAVTVTVETGLLAVATRRGHGTLSVVTALLAGQVALVWAIHRNGRTVPEGASRDPAGALRTSHVAAITVGSMLVPLLILTLDDDPRWDALPFVIVALPVAVAVSVGTLFRGPRARPVAAPRFGVAVEGATVAALAILAIAPT